MAFLIEQAKKRLLAADEAERLAHAWLVSGPAGSGKLRLVETVSKKILSAGNDSSTKKHPDFHEIKPESKSRRIVVKQIRDLEHPLQRKSMAGGRKVAVIHQADRLQPEAANAFLKTLEEPPPGVHIFLISSAPELILETILSRCVRIELRSESAPELNSREEEVQELTLQLLNKKQPRSVGDIFVFTRRFQALLTEAKAEILKSAKAELTLDKKQFKDSADSAWLEEREAQLEAASAGATLLERERLLTTIANTCAEHMDFLNETNPGATLAGIAAIERLDILRADLNRNVQEALALETGFLEAFRPLS
ncbi:MAG: hypothetical protein ACK5NG_01225 [Chthoniobacterales bacterium]